MASVSVVSSTDFRANLPQSQNPAPEGEEPFSLLLNAVADVKASVQRPEAPRVAERRSEAPSKLPKPETDADRQAKRQAKDTAKPETKPQSESAAPSNPVSADEEADETLTESGDAEAADALLAIALGEAQQPVVQSEGETVVATQTAAVPAVAAGAEAVADVQTAPVLAAATAPAADAAASELQPAVAKQNAVTAKPQFEAAIEQSAEIEITLPKTGAEKISQQVKPVDLPSSLQPQVQTQPGSVNVNNAAVLQGPAHLEMLNAAISKHAQLSLGLDAGETAAEVQKPLLSSNAVAPNFAMTAQTNAPVQVQTQQAAEASRAVPLDQLAVEIATRAAKGERRFDIRLDPPELGRIDVRLEIDSKGNTTTKLIVERAETLDMLQRDARGLEKALQNAGLKTDAGGMQFSLQQDTQTQHGHQNHAPEMRGRPDLVQADGEIMSDVSINSASLAAQIRGGVDIRI